MLLSVAINSAARSIEVPRDLFDDPEIKRRASADYDTLMEEIAGDLTAFEDSCNVVMAFYRNLPW